MFKKAGNLLLQVDELLENTLKESGQYDYIIGKNTFQWNNLFFSNKEIFLKLIESSFITDTCICKYLHKYFKLNGKIQSCLNVINKLKQDHNLQKNYTLKPQKKVIQQIKQKVAKTTIKNDTHNNINIAKRINIQKAKKYTRDFKYLALSDLGKIIVNDNLLSLNDAYLINEDSYFRALLGR